MRQRELGPERQRRGDAARGQATAYRVWITRYGGGTPEDYTQVPVDAVAREPAEGGTMSARQAARYVEVFNRAATARRRKLWAVALPVTIRYEGDPQPGEPLSGAAVFQGLGQSPQ